MANEVNHPAVQSVPYAATITPDHLAGKIVKVGTLTGNIAIANPSSPELVTGGAGPQAGAELIFDFTQDATGTRTITFGSAFLAAAYVPSTLAGYRDVVHFYFDGTNWVLISATVHIH